MKTINYLNKVFTIPYLDSLFLSKELPSTFNDAIDCLIKKANINGSITYEDTLKYFYKCLKNNHQNEYYYKNVLLNYLLVDTKKLNLYSAITELPIMNSKADFIVMDDKNQGIVYEIKTDLDTLQRLETQVSDYYKAFNYVYIVAGKHHVEQLENTLKDTRVGIVELTDNGEFVYKKKALFNNKSISFDTLFHLLRKKEYESIILKYFGELPQTTDFVYYQTCYKILETLDLDMFQKEVHTLLRKRNLIKNSDEYFKNVPKELSFYAYFSKQYRKKKIDIQCLLQTKISI